MTDTKQPDTDTSETTTPADTDASTEEASENATENTSEAAEIHEAPSDKADDSTKSEQASPLKSQLTQAGLILGGLALVAFLTTGGYLVSKDSQEVGGTNNTASTLSIPTDGPIATVNGVDVSGEQYARQIEQIEAIIAASGGSGPDVASLRENLQQQALDDMINFELLHQKATEAGITVDEAAVGEEMESIKQEITLQAGGDEAAFKTMIESLGLTESDVRELTERQLTIDAYISEQIGADEEGKTPEELQAAFSELVERLRNEADIEVFI